MVSSVNVPVSQMWSTYIISSNKIPSDTNSVRIRAYNSTNTTITKTFVTNCIIKTVP